LCVCGHVTPHELLRCKLFGKSITIQRKRAETIMAQYNGDTYALRTLYYIDNLWQLWTPPSHQMKPTNCILQLYPDNNIVLRIIINMACYCTCSSWTVVRYASHVQCAEIRCTIRWVVLYSCNNIVVVIASTLDLWIARITALSERVIL